MKQSIEQALGMWSDGPGPLHRKLSDAIRSAAENGRLPGGSVLFGGWTASRNVSVSCDQENPNGSAMNDLYYDISFQRGGRFCDERLLDIPLRHDFKLAGTLPLPYRFEFSGTIVSFAGNETQVTWDVPASVFPNGQRTAQTLVARAEA